MHQVLISIVRYVDSAGTILDEIETGAFKIV